MRQLLCISQFSARKTLGIIILEKSTRNKIFLEFLGDYSDCLKNFQRIGQKTRNCVFSQIFYSFENFVTIKKYGILLHQ